LNFKNFKPKGDEVKMQIFHLYFNCSENENEIFGKDSNLEIAAVPLADKELHTIIAV